MGRTAGYARISRDMHSEAAGVKRQKEDEIELCRRKGWPPPADEDWFIDNDRSASRFATKKRTEYGRLCKAIEDGEYDRVVMAVEDRTHRQILELAEFINLCREHGVTPATIGTEYDLSDPDQVTMWFIKVRFAEAEVEKTSKRVRRARRQEAEMGKPHSGGTRGFGERGRLRLRDADGKPLRDDDGNWRTVPAITQAQAEAERALIREAAARIVAGDSLRGIVLEWNARGLRGATGSRWTAPTLRRMLLAPRLAGLRDHNGQVLIGKDGQPVRLTRSGGITDGREVRVPAEPVVPRAQWEAVKAILEDPARKSGNGAKLGVTTVGGVARYLLTGMIWCGVCGAHAHGLRRDGKVSYSCQDPLRGGNRCVQRKAEPLEELITGALFEAVESPEWDRQADQPEDDPTRELYEMLARDQARLDKLDDEQIMAALDDDGVKAAAIRRVRHDIEERMERVRSRANRMRTGRVVAAVPRNLRAVWPTLSLDRRRAILAAVIERIVIYPQGRSPVFDPRTVEVSWRA